MGIGRYKRGGQRRRQKRLRPQLGKKLRRKKKGGKPRGKKDGAPSEKAGTRFFRNAHRGKTAITQTVVEKPRHTRSFGEIAVRSVGEHDAKWRKEEGLSSKRNLPFCGGKSRFERERGRKKHGGEPLLNAEEKEPNYERFPSGGKYPRENKVLSLRSDGEKNFSHARKIQLGNNKTRR